MKYILENDFSLCISDFYGINETLIILLNTRDCILYAQELQYVHDHAAVNSYIYSVTHEEDNGHNINIVLINNLHCVCPLLGTIIML